MLLLAFYVSPDVVGLYAWMVISLTFAQAAADVPLRHIAVEAISTRRGRNSLRRYAWFSAAASVVVLGATLAALVWAHPGEVAVIAQLLPLVLVPVMTLGAIEPVARLQMADKWHVLAGTQTFAALAAVAVSLPVLLLTGSILAAALQPLLAECVNMVVCRLRARRLPDPLASDPHTTEGIGDSVFTEWWGVQTYSLLGWAQGQADRIFVGLFAGASLLGSYSYATALGRTGGDAAINAGVNVVRTQLRRAEDLDSARSVLEKATIRMIAVCGAGVLAVWVLAQLVLGHSLDPSWDAALAAAPILAASAIPAAVTWHMSVALVVARRTRQALPARVVGVGTAVLVAIAAISSLQAAAVAVVLRELIVMTLMTLATRRSSPIGSIIAAWVLSALLVGALCLTGTW